LAPDAKTQPLPELYKYAASLQWSRETVLTTQTINGLIRVNRAVESPISCHPKTSCVAALLLLESAVLALVFPCQPFHSLEKPMLNVITVDFESALPTVKPPTFLDVGVSGLPPWEQRFVFHTPQATANLIEDMFGMLWSTA